MHFGEIIKKAWHITWHYRWLWVLGVFAGITGGSGGGGGGNTSSYSRSFGSSGGTPRGTSGMPDWGTVAPVLMHWLPFIVVVFFLMLLIGLAFAVIGIGARGGLVWAVNEIEEGRPPRLGAAWNAGFARFWSLLGVGVLLQLPIVVAALFLVAIVLVPILGPLMRGGRPDPGLVIAPICGVLAIGLPLILVAGVVLGIMYITAQRFIVLDGMHALSAVGESWRAFRGRLGDHVLMYIISLGLSVAAGLALAIPIVIVALATVVPAGIAAAGKSWGVFAGMIAVFVALIFVVTLLFTGVWGTFTSALWTIFFRRLTGREVLVAPPLAPSPPMYPPPAPPVGPGPVYQPPLAQAEPVPPAPEPPMQPADTQPPMYVPPTQPAPPAQDEPRD